ncbi:hypothetical protein ACQW5G_02655 [Fructilactobacillus sp. Tb1]|uniref:hypothetical protein n=1 Tax=Fructilactobacillus sp. Tb1 TaxID=3422304 RepID=UPI003D27E0D1
MTEKQTPTEFKDITDELNDAAKPVDIKAVVAKLDKIAAPYLAKAYKNTWAFTPEKKLTDAQLNDPKVLNEHLESLDRFELALVVDQIAQLVEQ